MTPCSTYNNVNNSGMTPRRDRSPCLSVFYTGIRTATGSRPYIANNDHPVQTIRHDLDLRLCCMRQNDEIIGPCQGVRCIAMLAMSHHYHLQKC